MTTARADHELDDVAAGERAFVRHRAARRTAPVGGSNRLLSVDELVAYLGVPKKTVNGCVLVSSHLMSELQDTAGCLVIVGCGKVIADTSTAGLLAGCFRCAAPGTARFVDAISTLSGHSRRW